MIIIAKFQISGIFPRYEYCCVAVDSVVALFYCISIANW